MGWLFGRLETITDPGFGQDEFGLGRILFNFLAQLIDDYSKILGFLSVFGSPNNLKKPPVRDRLAKIGNQMAQDFKLFRRQVDDLPGDGDTARLKIDRQFL